MISLRIPGRRAAGAIAGVIVGGLPFGGTLSLPAWSDEWYVEPLVQTQVLANDNITLDRNKKEEVAGGILSPQLRLGHRSETLDLSLTGRVDLNGYVVNSQLSSVDEKVGTHTVYTTELGKLGLDTEYSRDTIFDTPEENTGKNIGDSRLTKISASPSWSYQFTELDNLNLSAGYLDQSYSHSDVDRTDYKYYSASASWLHQFTETDALSSGFSYGRYEPDGSQSSNADIIDLQLGWIHDFSENVRLQAIGGPSLTIQQDIDPDTGESKGKSSDLGYNADVRLSYKITELASLEANYTRKTEPTGDGQTRDRDRIGLNFSYRIGELTTLRLAGNYTGNDTSNITGTSNSDDTFRRYLSVSPSITWQLQDDLDLALSYRFQDETFRHPSDDAYSNAVFLTLTYRAPRWSWSD